MGFNDINLQVSGPQQPASIYKTKVLKGQVPFATQVTEPNTKYVIKHNFELDGDVTIPANCILEFDGGSISGEHTITCQNTYIDSDNVCFKDLRISGTLANPIINLCWIDIENSTDIQMLLDLCNNNNYILDLNEKTIEISTPYVIDRTYSKDKPFLIIQNGNIKVLTVNGAFTDTISTTTPESGLIKFKEIRFFAEHDVVANPTTETTDIPVIKDSGFRRLYFENCDFYGVKLIDNTTKGYFIQTLIVSACKISECYNTFVNTPGDIYDVRFLNCVLESWVYELVKCDIANRLTISHNVMEGMDSLITFKTHRGISVTNNYFEYFRKYLIKATQVINNPNKGFVYTGNFLHNCMDPTAAIQLDNEDDYVFGGNSFTQCPEPIKFNKDRNSRAGTTHFVESAEIEVGSSVTFTGLHGFYFLESDGNYTSMLSITYKSLSTWLQATFEACFTVSVGSNNGEIVITNISTITRTVEIRKFI